jgi:hypothetical protein
MSDYVDHDMQLGVADEGLDSTDWGALQQEVMQEPWMDFIDWSAYGGYENTVRADEEAKATTLGIG